MEGYKPQDFSFFHRSEKLVQHMKQLSEECIKYSISNFRIEKIVEQWNKILK